MARAALQILSARRDTVAVDMVAQQHPEWRVDPEAWPEAIAATDGPQIVVGGPGTGKTEFLVRRAVHLLDTREVPPQELVILSFGRRGVADLRDRIRASLHRSISEIEVSTFHSYADRLLEYHARDIGWDSPPQILTGPEQTALVRSLLADEDPGDWSVAFRDLLGTSTFAREVTDFLLRTSEHLVAPQELAALAEDRNDWRGLPAFVERYHAELRATGRIDYGKLVAEAVRIAAKLPRAGPHYVLVDEYQDTTSSQAALLDALTTTHRNLTVAADPYQSIYSFRGAALHNVAEFPDRFRSQHGEPGRRLVLTTSFRTPRSILDAAVRVTAGDLPGAAGPVVPTSAPGRVAVHVFDQQTAEAEWIASEIERLHLADAMPLASIGVLVRSKRRFLPELSRSLERRGIAHDPPDSRLAEQPAVRLVLDLVAAAVADEAPAEVDRSVRRILLGPLFSLPLGRLRDIERMRIGSGHPWHEAIRSLVTDGESLAGLLADPSWADGVPARVGFWRIWSTLPQIAEMVTDPTRVEEVRAWSSLAQVIDRWGERNPSATLLDYRHLLEEEEFEARPLLSYRAPDDDRVTLTTLHQAKGLEFEVVFVADAVEGVFPDLRTRDSLLGVRHLLPHVPADSPGYRHFRLQEERRLAYTAMTRARSEVIWTATSTGFEEGAGVPSRFLALVAGTPTLEAAVAPVVTDRPPLSRREAESLLRRQLTDPAAPAPVRLAALSVLADGARYGLRSALQFSGVSERGPDTGIRPADLVLSPSQAEAFHRCPRRYALERRLRIGDASSIHAEFGSLIHEVLEAAERMAFEQGDDRSTLAEAVALLHERFDAVTFGGGPYAVAWLRRGEDLLTRLYELWPRGGSVIGLERPLSLEIDGVPWVGIADRIEAAGGTTKIIDYKTGRSLPTREEAAVSIQLGFYFSAAGADEELATHGPPVAAEMWFPAARSRGLTTREFDPARIGEVLDEMKRISDEIAQERWGPRPNPSCDRCPVLQSCPAWPQGGEAFE